MKQVKFEATILESELIIGIARRARKELHGFNSIVDAAMDIEATHCNGCPLDLPGLMGAKKVDFAHDLYGIRNNLDRATGDLQGSFTPRYAVKQ